MSCFDIQKEKAKTLLEDYRKEKKESLIYEAIALDDTNPNIIYEYLKILEGKNRYKFSDEFSKYKIALPNDLLLKFSTIEFTQKSLFFNMLYIIASINKNNPKNIVSFLKKKFGNKKYLSHTFRQPITIENINLFYYSVIVTIMEQIFKCNQQSSENLVAFLNKKIRYSIDYIKKIQNFQSIKEENYLDFHLFFFNFLFMESKLFEKFYDSLIIKKETDFNYFSNYLKNIKEFIIEIGKSNTIKSLLIYIDKNYMNYLKEIPDMIDYIFEKKLFFNNLESNKFSGMTITDTLDIYLSGKPIVPNSEIDKNNIYMPEIIIINFGKIIVTLIHEIFGHFFKLYLNKAFKFETEGSPKNSDLIQKFIDSKTSNENEKKIIDDFKTIYFCNKDFQEDSEGGDQLEIFLFGDRLNDISIIQSLYLLNIKNYEKDFYLFRNDFIKITEFSQKKSDFFNKYNLENNKENDTILFSDDKGERNITDEDFIFYEVLDFDKLKQTNENYIEPKEEEFSLKQKLSSQTRQDGKLELESKIENDEKIKEIKNKYLEEKKNLEAEEEQLNKIIYDLKFNSLLTKDLYDKFCSRNLKKTSFITNYDRVKLKTSKNYLESKVYFGKCGTNLAKRKIRIKNN